MPRRKRSTLPAPGRRMRWSRRSRNWTSCSSPWARARDGHEALDLAGSAHLEADDGSIAADCRREDLVVRAAVAAANTGAAAGGPDQTLHKGGPIDAVNRHGHVAEPYPLVG